MTAIMLYILFLSCGLAVAALLAERALAALDLPRRPAWLSAMTASVGLPMIALAIGARRSGTVSLQPAPVPMASNAAESASMTDPASALPGSAGIDWQIWTQWSDWAGWRLVDGAAWPVTPALDGMLAAAWLAGSAVVLLVYATAWYSVRRSLKRWPKARMAGTDVAIADRFGPAVFGLIDSRIIVPKWLLEQSDRMQSAVMMHERAHAAAKDTWWLVAAMFMVALMPWNPVMWWQQRRLRASIELDCDARVVRGGLDPQRYARVLVAVAERHAMRRRLFLLPGVVDSIRRASLLERRVKQLVVHTPTSRLSAVLGGAFAALVLAAVWSIEPPAWAQSIDVGGDRGEARVSESVREPLTGLAIGGERVVVLVDVSAGMLDRTADGVERLLARSPQLRRQAPKWTHLIETLESVTAKIPSGAQFQVILFNEQARAAIAGTDGQWLTATQGEIERSIAVLRDEVIPEGTSSLLAAFATANALEPPPDTVHLIVDGLPSGGILSDGAAAGEQERMQQVQSVIESVPPGAAVNVLLMPREGDSIAAAAYWVLTQRTGGSLYAPVEGGMRSEVPGVPVDADYLVFIVDVSGSMMHFGWATFRRHLRETLELHPPVRGIQLMTDMGQRRFAEYGDGWIPDTPATREYILDGLEEWSAFSNSTPREAIVEALALPYEAGANVALYVYGDDMAIGEVDSTIEAIEHANRDPDTGERRARINAVAIPAILIATGGELYTAATYAMVMRELSLRSGGMFVALPE
jgi:beta-lactamase regulating signal transducer with metallopeptidase domain